MKVGDTIGGRFVLERPAGRGAMGVVFRARDLSTGAPVALKIMTVVHARGAARFAREIEVLARLRHPGIVGYVAHGATSADGLSGSPFLAMEWLEGETLERRVERAPLTWLETVEVGAQIASALAAAHGQNVLHRDLKPSNVILVGGAVKVVDFGIARVLYASAPAGSGTPLTASGEMIGTPAFMSPEQAFGSREIDARSDLFSLGAVLYRCMSGVLPFDAPTALEILMRLTKERAAPLATVAPGVPLPLATLIDAMLSPAPEGRPASADAVITALANVRATMSAEARAMRPGPTLHPTSQHVAPRPSAKGSRRARVALFASGGAVAIALVVALAFTLGPSRRSSSAAASSSLKLVVGPPCPADALACAELDVRDPSAVDPFDAIPGAVALARRVRPEAEFMGLISHRMEPTGVDLTRGGVILIDLAAGLHVQVERSLLVLVDGALNNDQSKATPWERRACGPLEAYHAAVARGLRPGVAVEIAFVRAPKGNGQYHFIAAGMGMQPEMVLDYARCAP